MSFNDGSNIYNVWDDMTAARGHEYVTGSSFGSGDYILAPSRITSIAQRDLLRDPGVVVFPGSQPVLGEVSTQLAPIDIVTASLDGGRLSYEADLQPYVYGYSLYLRERGFVEAGKRLWIRVADARAQGATVSLRYRLDGGDEQEAQHYLGGNCYGYDRCFEINVPATATRDVAFRAVITAADGRETIIDDHGAPFVTPVIGAPTGSLTVTASGVAAANVAPGEMVTLSYDGRRAVATVMAQSSVYPGSILIAARVRRVGGTFVDVPLGTMQGGRDQNFRMTYRGTLGVLPVVIPADALVPVTVDFVLSKYHNGNIEGQVIDSVQVP